MGGLCDVRTVFDCDTNDRIWKWINISGIHARKCSCHPSILRNMIIEANQSVSSVFLQYSHFFSTWVSDCPCSSVTVRTIWQVQTTVPLIFKIGIHWPPTKLQPPWETAHCVTHHASISFHSHFSKCTSWWFRPSWKILVKSDHFPKDRGENTKYSIWNDHRSCMNCGPSSRSPFLQSHH